MKNQKINIYSLIGGFLTALLSLFSYSEIARYIENLSSEKTAAYKSEYISLLAEKSTFAVALIIAGILLMLGKKKAASIPLSITAAISLFDTYSYINYIQGNEINFAITLNNIYTRLFPMLFIAVLLIDIFSKKSKKLSIACFSLMSLFFIIFLIIKTADFSAWGKNLFIYFSLFFKTYGKHLFTAFLYLVAFSLIIAEKFQTNIKKSK